MSSFPLVRILANHAPLRAALRSRWRAMAMLSLMLFCGVRLTAQVTSSAILGYVFDPSGAAIPNAEVTVYDARHALTRHTVTDATGAYIVLGLSPARYTVTAAAPSFSETTQRDVQLEVNTQLRADFHLVLASVKKS